MSMFQTKHGEPVSRILQAYPPGMAQVMAIETYIRTVEANARRDAANDVAATVCEGLHNGPAMGLKCLACHEAEVNAPMEAQVLADIERSHESK